MNRFIAFPVLLIALLFALVSPAHAQGESADIDAAARGVVRVVIIAADEERGIVPISHGSGFAVAPKRIVTNAHVVRDAVNDNSLRVGIVPSEGGEAVYGRILKVSPRNDLALVEITGDLRLPPLVLSGEPVRDSGDSYAVGYPMNVDRAQGLEIGDIFKAQPPVKSRGFLAGTRPSRQFHTVLHTAPIASGNSGGPLLDSCGRVLGVNSFGADSAGADAEFFFAVSNRELGPFLRENGVEPRANDTQCRSLAALDADEQARIAQEQMAARAELASRSAEERARRERAQFEAEMQVRDERDDRMFASVLLLLLGAGAAWWAYEKRASKTSEGAEWPAANKGAAAAGAGFVLIALFLQLTRPGIDEIDRRVANALGNPDGGGDGGETGDDPQVAAGNITYLCTIDKQRSRITRSDTEDVEFSWNNGGCVNERTQYGFSGGTWSRAFVPNDEQAVSVASFDPQRRIYRTERYLLSRSAMETAREARSMYKAPSCGAEDAAATLGDQQSAVLSALPARPNERLVYSCEAKSGD
ncbi:S1 family peptidase [Erythrobacter sp. W53]|uniref:S1 family peptidase n=1 Tax=Erythrobacter sp. W53 TaxID=3425947 RepID=UPI003D7685F8